MREPKFKLNNIKSEIETNNSNTQRRFFAKNPINPKTQTRTQLSLKKMKFITKLIVIQLDDFPFTSTTMNRMLLAAEIPNNHQYTSFFKTFYFNRSLNELLNSVLKVAFSIISFSLKRSFFLLGRSLWVNNQALQ